VNRVIEQLEYHGFLVFEVANPRSAGSDLVAIAPHGLTCLVKCKPNVSTMREEEAALFLSLARAQNVPAILAYRDEIGAIPGAPIFKHLRSVRFEEEYWHPGTAESGN